MACMTRSVACLTLLLVVVSSFAVAQDRLTEEKRQQLIELLDRSPLLEPTMSVVAQARYLRDTRSVLEGYWAESETSSVEDATLAIQDLLAGTTVTAAVLSEPADLNVTYRLLVDVDAPVLSVTTAASIQLSPGLYVFTCTSSTGVTEQKNVSCATNCEVRFVFPRH